MSDRNARVPKLRFPDFRDAEDWEEKRLGDVATIITGNTPKTAELDNYGGNKFFVSPADITDLRYVSATKKTLSEKGFSQTRSIAKNSIMFVCIGSTIGKIAQNKYECATNQQINTVIPFDCYSNGFIYFILEIDSEKIAEIAGKQAVPIINKSLFSSVLISIPTLLEQQKIADCLTSLDDLITAETQKLERLKAHKKGLMQQLFPAEGETIPRLRFPEFRDAEDWEEKRLGELGKTYGGLTGKTKESFGSGDSYIQYMQIFSGSKIDISGCGFVEIGNGEKQNQVEFGDVFFTTSSETPLEIGTASVLLDTVKQVYLNSFCFGYRPNLKMANPAFLQFAFREQQFRKKIVRLAQGSTRFNMSKIALMKISIGLPSLTEQQKIAACLMSIDDLITAQGQKLDALKTHKKGLMQQLFPATDEKI